MDSLEEIRQETKRDLEYSLGADTAEIWCEIKKLTWDNYNKYHVSALAQKSVFMQRRKILSQVIKELSPRIMPYIFPVTLDNMTSLMQAQGYTLNDRVFQDFLISFMHNIHHKDALIYADIKGYTAIVNKEENLENYLELLKYYPFLLLTYLDREKPEKSLALIDMIKPTTNLNMLMQKEDNYIASLLNQALYFATGPQIIVKLIQLDVPFVDNKKSEYTLIHKKEVVISRCQKWMKQDRDWTSREIKEFNIMAEKLLLNKKVEKNTEQGKKFKI